MSTSQPSAVIRNRKQEILDRWVARVQDEIPDARERNRPIIIDGVPNLLDAMVDALASDDAREIVHQSQRHGRNRAHYTKYRVDQIVREYRLLKETVFSVVDEEGIHLEPRERDGILYAIDQAIEQAIAAFDKISTKKNQQAREKAKRTINELEARDGLRNQFVAALSHDIRGPLNNADQLAQLLEGQIASSEDPFVSEVLSGIRMSAHQGSELIDTLMDVSLIQSGNPIPLQKSQGDLLKEVRDSLEGMKPALRERITIDSPHEKIMGHWDAKALNRAVNNLISNAVKHGAKEGTITLSFRQDEHQTTVEVHNTGNPIPPGKIDKLFKLYYRAKDTKTKGWGLGLTLVKGIVDLHGGNVQVHSNIAQGTTFTLQIPNTT
ncbi:MAG: sensor histidine kinase [Bacteroidota bacterium]